MSMPARTDFVPVLKLRARIRGLRRARKPLPFLCERFEPRLLRAFGDDQLIFRTNSRLPSGIYVANNDGSEPTSVLTPHQATLSDPCFNPDETKILYGAWEEADIGENYEIYVADADGSNEVQLTSNNVFDGEATWTPDGDRIVFVSERDGNEEIYIMNADGSNPVRLTNDPGADTGPAVHPSGRLIAFESTRSGDLDVCLLNLDGSGDVTPVGATSDNEYDPAFSPDGEKLVIVSDRDDNNGELYLFDNSMPGLLRLTDNLGVEYSPSFSPDSTRVAANFSNAGGGDGEIWSWALTGTNADETELVTGFDDGEFQWASAPEIAVRTGNDDTLTVWGTGTADNVSLRMEGGNDLIVTRGNRSLTFSAIDVSTINVFMGAGNDVLTAAPGENDLQGVQRFYAIGGPGDDVMVGGDGNDTLTGGSGRNTLFGGNGDDRLNGSNGRDFLYGDGGNDRLYGNAGNDYMVGGGNIDRMWGGDGDDFLSGVGGNDKLFGENGADQLFGGDGNDFHDGGEDIDIINGQKGEDSANGREEDTFISIETF